MSKYPLVRTIYLYLFSLVGLVLLIIGAVRFIDMALKAFIFTKADEEQRLAYKMPPSSIPFEKVQSLASDQQGIIKLTPDEKTAIVQWLADYNSWKEQRDKLDPITSQRQRDASSNLAMILVGLPLYFFHWRIIRKDANAKGLAAGSN